VRGTGRGALVTGGAGFVGGHLVEGLLGAGWSVRVIDDLSTGREANLCGVRGRVDLRRADIRDPSSLADAMAGVEVVFHQAALPSVPLSVAEPLRTHAVNSGGTLQVLECARRAGVRRVVYAASSSAYGDAPELPKREDMPARPRSPYALQKYSGEVYCALYAELYGLETVALRYFNVFGPRQNPDSPYAAVIPRFLRAASEGRAACIDGDGGQTRDFTYVADAVRANLLAADAPRASGSVVNVAAGRRTSILALWRAVCEILGREIEPRHGPARAGDVRDSLADLERARALLGYEPAVPLREGLEETARSLAQPGQEGAA
jgi:nucleoside-diphosphate-sugar epimerase